MKIRMDALSQAFRRINYCLDIARASDPSPRAILNSVLKQSSSHRRENKTRPEFITFADE
jgi:hypothetical protein